MTAAVTFQRSARHRLRLGAALSIGVLPALSPAVAAQVSTPVDIRVPVAPSPFNGDGMTHLVWELHITNFAPVPVTVTRVRAGDSRDFAMD